MESERKMHEGNLFEPYIAKDKIMPEFTITASVLGALLAVVFGAANAYLGLRVGMTVSASIPAAVISMGIIRILLKKESILENNMVQTVGSAGESLAAGAIFTLPAIFMWAQEGIGENPTYLMITLVVICGGLLGVVFMIPLRKALIVQEHGKLLYPEGVACAEVLIAGEEGGAKANIVFAGLGISAIYKFFADGLKIFPSEVDYSIPAMPGAGIGMDVLPALAGVGYICGAKIASYMTAGGILTWLIIMPLIKVFGGDIIIYPSKIPVAQMDSWMIWSSYIRYIGAGAVATGGIISLIKSFPLIVKTFKDSLKSVMQNRNSVKDGTLLDRTDEDLSPVIMIAMLVIVLGILLFSPNVSINLISGFVIIIFGFFFATVSSRMVGLVGSSNNPVSGMAIATLLFATVILKNTGSTGASGMVTAITIGTIICIVAAMAGDMSQDLKTGYIVGATPKKQQYGEIIGVIVSGLAIAGILYLLNSAWGYGSKELPAPQATLMKLIIEGVMSGNLPWNLVYAGVFLAIVMEILRIPVLPVAIGLYLPIHLSTPIMAGGLLRLYFEKKKYKKQEDKDRSVTNGMLYSSGLIAGEGLVGIVLAIFAIIPMGSITFGEFINLESRGFSLGNIGGLVIFLILLSTILKFSLWRNVENGELS